MITIDGSKGGGQLLRSSLTLSLLTGQKFRIKNIRQARPKPGLQRQHLVCVKAAQEIGDAAVDGAELGSCEIIFAPGTVSAGDYEFNIGSAGSTTLVYQTILLPLALLGKTNSTVRIVGGTHNSMAPPFEFIEKCFLPVLGKMGLVAEFTMLRHGFMPAGGGVLHSTIAPWVEKSALLLTHWPTDLELHATAYCANLKAEIGQRELAALQAGLEMTLTTQQILHPPSDGPGNCLLVEARSPTSGWSEIAALCGEVRRSAESVGEGCAKLMQKYLALHAPVGGHLQDQLQIPLALCGGEYHTGPLRDHFVSQQEVIQAFLGKSLGTEDLGKGKQQVRGG